MAFSDKRDETRKNGSDDISSFGVENAEYNEALSLKIKALLGKNN